MIHVPESKTRSIAYSLSLAFALAMLVFGCAHAGRSDSETVPDIGQIRSAYIASPVTIALIGDNTFPGPALLAQTERRIREYLVNGLGWSLVESPSTADAFIRIEVLYHPIAQGGGVSGAVWI